MKRSLSLVIVLAMMAGMLAVPLPMFAQEGSPPDPAPDAQPSPPALYLPVIVAPTSGSEVAQSPVETSADAAISLDDLLSSDAGDKPVETVNAPDEGVPAPEPGLESPVSESADEKPVTIESDVTVEASAVDGWTALMSEGFEGAFPNSSWRVFDGNGTTSGEYYWDDDDYMRRSGSWSAWAANGGANALDPQVYNYPNNMQSWMVFGPFDLSNAADAELLFYYWNRSEANYDYFGWYASANGTNFYGTRVSGDSLGWKYVNFDLTAVPGLGNLKGDSSVWIAFIFTSDGSITNKGPFVDDIVLQKLVNTVSCPNQYKAEYFNNRTLSGSPTVTRCENWPINYNWGNGSPASGIGSDNFSVRWTGTAYFAAGTYTFLAAADDGVRVWLDNALIIDAWRDQRPTAYRTNRTLSAGNHSVKIEYYEYGGGAVAQFSWSTAVTNGVPGITYGTRDGFHVFKIDLWSANLSYETVMGRDATSGNTTNVEYVRDMVARSPYVSRNPVLAFNADYFGENHHGAEGLTVKLGTRLPNAGTANGEEWRRSSLSISSTKAPRVGVQTDCKGPPGNACTTWVPNRDSYFNTVGGGPLFVKDGIRVGGSNSTLPCTTESLSTSYCNGSFNWTAAGASADGRYLIVIVSGSAKTMNQAAAALIAEGAYRAIKLDGGGSSQVWYKPNGSLVYGSRRVTNALMVFSSQ